MLLIVGRSESDVVHAAASQVCPRSIGPLDHPYRGPRTPVPDLEGHHLARALHDLVYLPEAENFGEDPRGGVELAHRKVDGPETPDPHRLRNRAVLPGNPAR